jgi:XRE family transcriptional regulator, aerobic/anaerobic benzoate catabolism transcriptional regulator
MTDPKPAAQSRLIESRRGGDPHDETYLRRVGERLRMTRAGRGMSRKVLAVASGVSERYLAELERGAGNASLLVMRQIAAAMSVSVADLVAERSDAGAADRAIDLSLVTHQLERLSPAELAEARALLSSRFRPVLAPRSNLGPRRIALTGLRGAGKTTLGLRLAAALGVAFIELDRAIERSSGMDLSEMFASEGQAGFRRREYACLAQTIASNDACVIATGGSLVTEPATYDLLLSSCYVIWLSAKPETHMDRVAAQGDWRPMKSSRQAMEDLKAILDARQALYTKADARFDTTATTVDDALAALLHLASGTIPDLADS